MAESTSSKKFLKTKSMLHFVNNRRLTPTTDKMAKIDPLNISLNDVFVNYGLFHCLLRISESMVPYFGRPNTILEQIVHHTHSHTHYPLASHDTPSVCVTSSLQSFPPLTTILTRFSFEVPQSFIIFDGV